MMQLSIRRWKVQDLPPISKFCLKEKGLYTIMNTKKKTGNRSAYFSCPQILPETLRSVFISITNHQS